MVGTKDLLRTIAKNKKGKTERVHAYHQGVVLEEKSGDEGEGETTKTSGFLLPKILASSKQPTSRKVLLNKGRD